MVGNLEFIAQLRQSIGKLGSRHLPVEMLFGKQRFYRAVLHARVLTLFVAIGCQGTPSTLMMCGIHDDHMNMGIRIAVAIHIMHEACGG